MALDNRRIAKNTMMLYIRMLLLMAVSLYTSRVVLAALGVDDFGIFNLIGGFITLFSFISSSLVGAMQRYFNVCLGKNDKAEYQRVYSMGINIFVLFSLFLIVLLVSTLSIVIPLILSLIEYAKWTVLLIVLVDLVWVAMIIYLCGLEKDERSYILNMFISKRKRKLNLT